MLHTTIAAPKGAKWIPWHVIRAKGKAGETEVETLHLVWEDMAEVMNHYGPSALAFLDGTSFRVWQDGVWRTNDKASVDAICAKIIAYRPGSKTRTQMATFVAADGKFYANAQEAQAASLAFAFDQLEKEQQA